MRFFHKMANAHKRRNNVDIIRINGVWLSEENEIKEGWSVHFGLYYPIRGTDVLFY